MRCEVVRLEAVQASHRLLDNIRLWSVALPEVSTHQATRHGPLVAIIRFFAAWFDDMEIEIHVVLVPSHCYPQIKGHVACEEYTLVLLQQWREIDDEVAPPGSSKAVADFPQRLDLDLSER